MNSVVTLRASIKQAKIEIDRLSALFDPTGLQDDVGDLSFIPPSFYFARAQVCLLFVSASRLCVGCIRFIIAAGCRGGRTAP